MGSGHHPRTRKERERGPRHGGKGHHDRCHDPHRRGDQRRPHPHHTPQNTPPKQTSDAMRITPAHAHRPPETTRRTEGTTTRGERTTPTEEAAGNTAASLRPRPPQRPTHRHRKRTKARPRHPRLRTDTPRGHETKAQAPREGNPTDRHATTPWAIRAGLRYRRGLTQSIATGA